MSRFNFKECRFRFLLMVIMPFFVTSCAFIQQASVDSVSLPLSSAIAQKDLTTFYAGLADEPLKEPSFGYTHSKEVVIKSANEKICLSAEEYWANENIDYLVDHDGLYSAIDKQFGILYYAKGYDKTYYSSRNMYAIRTWSKYFIVGDGSTVIRYQVRVPNLNDKGFYGCHSPTVSPGYDVTYNVRMSLWTSNREIDFKRIAEGQNAINYDSLEFFEKRISYFAKSLESVISIANEDYQRRQDDTRHLREKRAKYLADRKIREGQSSKPSGSILENANKNMEIFGNNQAYIKSGSSNRTAGSKDSSQHNTQAYQASVSRSSNANQDSIKNKKRQESKASCSVVFSNITIGANHASCKGADYDQDICTSDTRSHQRREMKRMGRSDCLHVIPNDVKSVHKRSTIEQ